jgi:hypothetical protein
MSDVSAVGNVPPVVREVSSPRGGGSYTDRQTVTRVLNAVDGKTRIIQDVYNVTIYDSNGLKKSVTNAHTVDFLV